MTQATLYFYPASRAHHAHVMAIDFGMQFSKKKGFWTPVGLLAVTGAGGYKIEIAEESLGLLEPRVGDVLYSRIGGGVSVEEMLSDERALQTGPHIIQRGGRIIQRNGTAFYWPEQEKAGPI